MSQDKRKIYNKMQGNSFVPVSSDCSDKTQSSELLVLQDQISEVVLLTCHVTNVSVNYCDLKSDSAQTRRVFIGP